MEKVSVRAKLVNKLLIVAVVILISFIICLQIAGVNFEQQAMMAIVIFVLATSGALFYLHQTIDILAAKLDLVDSSLPYLKNNDLNGFDNLNQDAYPAFFRSVSRLMVLEEKELATSNEQLAAINKSLAVIEFNIDGTIITANDNFLMTLGYRLEEIQGQHHSMFVDPEYKTSIEYQQFWAKLNRGEYDNAEYKRIGKFGKEIWIQASYNPIFDLNGNVYKVVKFATEVTSTKLIMADFEGQIAAIDKSQAVIEFNMDGTIINANDNVLNTVGYQLNEIKGQHHSMFVEPEYKVSSEYQQFWQKLNRGEFEADEFKRIGQGGKEVWIQASYNPIFDLNGKPFKVVKYASDITEQKNQAAATALIARTVSALDVCQANVMMADADYNIVYVNEAVTAMLSTNEQQLRTVLPRFNVASLIGTNIDTFHKNPAHQRGMLDNLKSTYQTDLELAGFTFGLIATPVFNNNGERLGTVVEWNDRTAEVAIEKEIDGIIASAGRGELDARLEEGDKSGFFLNLTQGLNTLVEIVDDAVAETGFMLDAMAHGDLTKRIEKDYQGSFDKLKRDANTTAEKLTEVIDQINTSATLVASGAEEISQGNADLSQRTEEQASSLEETASSMEEMTSTVRQNADNAKVANELAANTQEQASQGGQVVQRAVTSMAEINDSSKKISDIIGVIDEIAFQTNLLALNAAVEAARAGEQGRGFAVVAGEVRNLAQRSAAAAKEIKELIRDSVSKVEDGTLLVNESGTTLQKIVLSVQKVTEMIADITVASEEQSSGIEQVNKAITQMDEMTQQNAALVEEASAAGESMAEQANGMRQLLTFFKSNAGGNASALPAPTYSKPAPKVTAPSRAQRLSSPSTGDDFVDSADEWEEF